MQITESMRRGIGMTSERTRRRLIDRLREAGIRDNRVLEVIFSTPRHLFVDEALASRAYEDTALPIGHGQTISQPYTVARMTELALAGGTRETVLEVGTGCGYQASVLAQLVKRVYTVERIDALLAVARKRFRQLRLSNVRSRHADGQWGWPENGPYDAILVAAAPEEVPRALLTQLAPGGCLVLPVGAQGRQRLAVIRHTAEGFVQEDVEMASFVPLLGGSV